MCYSAQILAAYKRYVRVFGAVIDLEGFHELFFRRLGDMRIKIPKGLELEWAGPEAADGGRIRALQAEFVVQQSRAWEEDLFKQRKRLADAERTLATKPTKAATESRRIAAAKVAWLRGKIADLHRTEPAPDDNRIYPGHYAPVMVMEGGRRVIKPMRYQCRPSGRPADFDRKFPGTYNARRDNLGGFWKALYGFSHGVLVANAFYENVPRHAAEHRPLAEGEAPENLVIEFRPRPAQEMLIACLWSRWTAPGEPALLSFAAITDDPPPEVAAAGHDRCVIPIAPERLDDWLDPSRGTRADWEDILSNRARPYFEHRLAA